MPLPSLLAFAFASGLAAAIAARVELRVSPRPPLLTRSFAAWTLFSVLILVPVSVYFYVFHGDWFLLYAFDVARIPSAVALMGFVLEIGLGALGFVLGASLVRSQREVVAGGLLGLTLLVAVAVPILAKDRLSQVGSFAQYRGGFGLEPYGDGALFAGTLAMSSLTLAGFAFLLARLYYAARRR
ncbi:MAG: hypothetical protein GXP55_06730 [Deltaproteobacteria bacterium]|nr:hypothetical protein [Deltaproteobacteria bacterium]